jgi:uncharacterized protein (TIGR00730 family)
VEPCVRREAIALCRAPGEEEQMTDEPNGHGLTRGKFYKAEQEASFADAHLHTTPQTRSESYRLAFRDTDFLLRDELRPVRFQLELLKAEMLLDEARIGSTLVVYGSARIPAPDMAEAALAVATTPERRAITERLVEKSRYYEEARRLGHIATSQAIVENGMRQFVVCSGGGPSIMEAANRGAVEAGGETIGLNIVLRHEQAPNAYVTPGLSFQFHYFALRKMHFLLRARAVAVFPGGYGTFDEMFELLCLIQTGKMKPIPILLFGGDFWKRVINFEALAEEGVINHEDLNLFTPVESAEGAWEVIRTFYKLD